MKMMTPPNSAKLLPRRPLLHHLPSNRLLRLCLPLKMQSIKTNPLRLSLKMLYISKPEADSSPAPVSSPHQDSVHGPDENTASGAAAVASSRPEDVL
jgi:hypothetical protein